MSPYLCLVRTDGAPVTSAERERYSATRAFRGAELQWRERNGVMALGSADGVDDVSTASAEPLVGVGIVRLDNRAEVARLVRSRDRELSDLDLVLRAFAEHGEECFGRFIGDFALLIWNRTTREIFAARDAFGVRTLYYTRHAALVAFASRARLLALDDRFDVQYLCEMVSYCPPSPERTPYAGVAAVPAATTMRILDGKARATRFWSAADAAADGEYLGSEGQIVERFRALHAEAVQARLTGTADSWAQLSGGLDSSSVVSMAQWLASRGAVRCGLAGTVTWVDDHGTGGDEREYSDAIVARYGLRNELVSDDGDAKDDDVGPPLTDEPTGRYPFYQLDRRTASVVLGAGGRVMLTGVGGDHLLLGNMFFFADWVAAGRVRDTVREIARRAALGRVSFWELAYKNALLPNLPTGVQRALVTSIGSAPSWIPASAIRRYDLVSRQSALNSYSGRIGHKYADHVAHLVSGLQGNVGKGYLDELLEMRHPYLHRPLVEFALRLPPDVCVRPHARKWVLREAMRGILPEAVRQRVGKGTASALVSWWVSHDRDRLTRLLRDPILPQLGCVDLERLRAAVTELRPGREKLYLDVFSTLALEMWLQVRSGRWTGGTPVAVQGSFQTAVPASGS